MKIRNGFVSNSSSASFIIKWQIDDETYKQAIEDGIDVFDRAFCLLFDVYIKNSKPNFSIWKQEEQVYNDIKKHTIMDKNTFCSTFSTIMLNSVVDFGSSAAYLLLALETTEVSNSVKLIEKHIEYR